MGIVSTQLQADSLTGWQSTARISPVAIAYRPPSTPRLGQTSTDSAGNVYTYRQGGWQLTTPAASPTVPSTATAAPVTASTSFPANPTIGQTYTDASGNIWTYGSTGWTQTSPAAAVSSTGSFFTDSTIISGVPNYWLIGGGGLLLILLMKGRR